MSENKTISRLWSFCPSSEFVDSIKIHDPEVSGSHYTIKFPPKGYVTVKVTNAEIIDAVKALGKTGEEYAIFSFDAEPEELNKDMSSEQVLEEWDFAIRFFMPHSFEKRIFEYEYLMVES